MATGAYGFYKNNEMKISSYSREGNPKSLGRLFLRGINDLYPEEVHSIFDNLKMVNSYDKPSENELEEISEC